LRSLESKSNIREQESEMQNEVALCPWIRHHFGRVGVLAGDGDDFALGQARAATVSVMREFPASSIKPAWRHVVVVALAA
jgi:hypothetical protein